MDQPMIWQRIAFVVAHMSLFELPLILLFTALSSWRLAVVLNKHDARLKEAQLARKIAAFYAALLFTTWSISQLLQ
ncbi:MAG: hypothetical protein K0Q77_2196 [Anaerosporomusa subterranea]|jgi:hypothetical protein|nr:hypothetical protein [Anaerosporomusa subterranea]